MRSLSLISALLLAAVLGTATATAKTEHAAVGTLDCDISAGIGAIVGSKQDVSCIFRPSGGGTSVHYVGNITEFGLDIGEVAKAKMTWLVFDATDKGKDGLSGVYRGATADASAGIGGGIKILVGGGDGSLSLQPLSVEGEEGLNLAVGVTALTLRQAA
jgi:hypothetical protein